MRWASSLVAFDSMANARRYLLGAKVGLGRFALPRIRFMLDSLR